MTGLCETIKLLQFARQPWSSALQELKSKTAGLQDAAVQAAFEAELTELTSLLEARTPETIVGLFGGTGHGKSTTLNALFPSIRLPTSDSNACTPIPIIIRGKGGEGIDVRVVFLDEAEFAAERKAVLEHCFSVKEHGYSEETGHQQATARSRLTALYPKLKVEDFDRTSDELERELSRLDVECGIDKHIRDGELRFFCHTADEFAEKAQKYGASAELENEDAVVLWPIIKEMHVQVNSSILKQGLVVVDIPGTMDTEVARADVAKGWMRKCTSPVIVASCDRAVDSPDVWDRVGDIIWDNQMTGNNSRFTIVLTQIDKGLKVEAERHVAGNQTYASLSSDLTLAETELAQLYGQEKIQEAKSQRIQRACQACSELLIVAIEGPVKEPSWWSQIQNQGWVDSSPVAFDTNTIEDIDQNNRLDSRVIADKTKQLSASLKEILVLSESPDLVKKEIQRLKQEMHRCRTDAKVAAIRSKIINKVADKMAEQALTRSQARGDDDFDSEKFQPAAFEELARELTTVIGVCGPAAMAVLARDSREDMDERYHVWPDRESTGLVTLERFFAQLVNETVAAHEKSWFNGTKENLLRLQIMSSFDQELVKGDWWASNGITLCATISKSIRKELTIRTEELEKTLRGINDSACDKGIKDTLQGVQKAKRKDDVILLDPEYIVKPLQLKVEELQDLNSATLRAILRHRGVHLAKRKKKTSQAYNLNTDLGAHIREVTEGFLERDLRKQVYIARNHIVKCIKDSFSQLHQNVQNTCTTPKTRNNQVLQLCYTANKREQERCILHIDNLFKALIGEAARLPREIIQSGIKSYMSQFYDEIELYFADRKATQSRGEKVPGRVTEIVRGKLESFLAKEAPTMLRHAANALKTALSTVVTDTIGPATSTDRESTLDKAISNLQRTYSQAFNPGQRSGRASPKDIAQLRAIYVDATTESARLEDISLQIEQKPVLRLKRAADMELHPQQKIMKLNKDSQAEQKRSLSQTVDLTEFD